MCEGELKKDQFHLNTHQQGVCQRLAHFKLLVSNAPKNAQMVNSKKVGCAHLMRWWMCGGGGCINIVYSV